MGVSEAVEEKGEKRQMEPKGTFNGLKMRLCTYMTHDLARQGYMFTCNAGGG